MFIKKIAIFAVIAAVITGFNLIFTTEAAAANTPAVSTVKTQKIPAGVKEASKKFGLWSDIYNSPKKVVVYSYMSGSTCPYQSQEFHNKITAAASRSGGKYYARPTGPDRMEKEVNAASAKINARAKQAMKNAELRSAYNRDVQAFNKLLNFTNQCTLRACIINPSKDEYIMMNRKSDEVVKTMSKYK